MKRGFFISCIMNREAQGFREFVTRMAALDLGGITECAFPVHDFAQQLHDELFAYKSAKNFVKFDEYRSILLVESRLSLLPSQILVRIREAGIEFFNVQRILPLDLFIKYDEEAIKAYIMGQKIEGSFKILYEGRLCRDGMKEQLFKAILPHVQCQVALDRPEYIIVAQAYKSYIGLSVVKGDARNFNFSMKHAGI